VVQRDGVRPAGRRVAARWLDTPVQHLREVRTELLVNLALRERVRLDNEPLLNAQQELFEPVIEVLTSTHDTDNVIDVWRRESARAVWRLFDQALHTPGASFGVEARDPTERPQPASQHRHLRRPR
jgi:hypothetical protein